MKRFAALMLCAALLVCTACGGNGTASDASLAEATAQLTKEEQKLYDEFLTAQFRWFFETREGDSSQVYKKWRTPPQRGLSNWTYAFYALEQDGTHELLQIHGSLISGEEYGVYAVYGIWQGKVLERRLNVFNVDAFFCYPIVLSNGTLRSTIDYGYGAAQRRICCNRLDYDADI